MDLSTARSLSDLTTDFYQRVSASFSATRQTPWDGWDRLLEVVGPHLGDEPVVLDLACGNLRFERFLAARGVAARAWAADNCDALMCEGSGALGEGGFRASCRHLDIAGALFATEGPRLADAIDAPPADLAVCFGFLHHVAYLPHRTEVLRALVAHARPGAHVAVSLWQLEHSPRLLAKARPVEGGGRGDYLLGWQEAADAWRYCHSFSEDEVDELSAACAPEAREVARFSADGRTGDLNRYLVLRRC